MVLNDVTKFYKIRIKVFDLESGRRLDRHTYVRKDSGYTLNAPAIVMAGA